MRARISVIFLTFFLALGIFAAGPAAAQDVTYYVSATGSDANDGLSAAAPFSTLAKTAQVINAFGDSGKNYLVYVMSDLTASASARYYNNSVTIKSLNGRFTVTRGAGFAISSDTARGLYNPAMLEIESTDLTLSPTTPLITMTLENIVFDDAYLHEGTIFGYAPAPSSGTGTTFVQDAIVASYANNATIQLNDGAELRNFGGMTALRAVYGVTVKMNSGSLITDIRPNANTNNRQVSTSTTDWNANGEAAVSISGSYLYMYAGSKITNIANAHSIKFTGTVACFMDGEIANMIGNKGMDTDPGNGGRGVKSAMYFAMSPTVDYTDPQAKIQGYAVIGPNADIHNNATKSGTVSVSRNVNIWVKIYGKINNNTGGTGSTLNLAGTNGGGIYIVAGGTVYLEDGSQVIGNSVSGSAYGGAASVQQNGSRLIMNGGTVSGNRVGTSSTSLLAGIVVSKGNASFEMNGGVIDNGAAGLRLYESGSDGTAGILTLNAGTVSGVTVDRAVVYGHPTRGHLFIAETGVTIGTGYASVNGWNVTPVQAGFKIGNPNTAAYQIIRNNLPQGWSLPSTDTNVIGFWEQKGGPAVISVPKPTGSTLPTGYDSNFDVYALAVVPTDANGVPVAGAQVYFLPAAFDNGQILVNIPVNAAGAVIALVQPTANYGSIVFAAPVTLPYVHGAASYTIPYTANYPMPPGWRDLLVTDGHTSVNTQVMLVIRPDAGTVCDMANMTLASAVFAQAGAPVWDAGLLAWRVPLVLKNGWDTAANLGSDFAFSCTLAAANFTDGGVLQLSGNMTLTGGPNNDNYNIYGNVTNTQMLIPMQTVTFNGNGGAVQAGDAQRQLKQGQALGTLPANPLRDQYTFAGWNTKPDGTGTAFTGATVVTGDITVYAQWQAVTPVIAGSPANPIPTLGAAALALLALGLMAGSAFRRRM